jgi:hypothetical protein
MCTLVYSMFQKNNHPKIDQLMDIHQRTFRLAGLDCRNDDGVLLEVLKEEDDDDSCMDDSW